MSSLHQKVRRTIRRYGLCPVGSRLLIGVSGGSDSVALTWLLVDLAARSDFSVAALAHFNHRLRESARRDEDFCRELATRLRLPIHVDAGDVRGYAAAQRLSVEDAARRLRYDFLHRVAADAGADRVAVGHTQDDQAETFVLKLMRGAGATGLGGIYPRRGTVIRPLIDTSRDELRAHLHERGESWVDDETNADLGNPRNRIRHGILPELDRIYGGPTRSAIARAADLVREDGQWLDQLASRRFGELTRQTANGLAIDASALAGEPRPIQRRMVLEALRAMAGPREVGLDHVDAVMAVLTDGCRGVDVPGARVELRRQELVFLQQGAFRSDTLG